MLEQAKSDCLILLDCCAAASSATSSGNGITEIIAACGFEAWAPGVGQHSFTRSLIDELRYLSQTTPFSTSFLHSKVLSRVKYWKPRYAPSASHREMRKTPIYIVISNATTPRSIEIQPRQREVIAAPNSDVFLSASSASPSRGSAFSSLMTVAESVPASEETSQSTNSSIDEIWPDPMFECPKVLLSVALEEEQWLSPQHWIDWLKSIPGLVKFAKIEGIYKSHSTLLTISVPIAVWNLIPANLAITFMGFQHSCNLMEGDITKSGHPLQVDLFHMRGAINALLCETQPAEDGVGAQRVEDRLEAKEKELETVSRELSVSREEARRAWEEIGRLGEEQRKLSRSGESKQGNAAPRVVWDHFRSYEATDSTIDESEPQIRHTSSSDQLQKHEYTSTSSFRPPSTIMPVVKEGSVSRYSGATFVNDDEAGLDPLDEMLMEDDQKSTWSGGSAGTLVSHSALEGQRKSTGDGSSPDDVSTYSRTPALLASHKMAERKKRTEMKYLFDTLRSKIPSTYGSKSSKWEILSKGAHCYRQLIVRVRN